MSADFLRGQPTLNTDNVLNGRYEVGELIGRGGMADVYLGRDIRLGRTVAIKVLRPDLARDPLFQSRFRREAQAVAGLNHPSVVSVYDTGDQESASTRDDVRLPYIVMEYVPGRTLRDLLKADELTIDKSVEYVLGVLAALDYSHRSGIVHRDIKPANVMVTVDGGVKVMDFGIARAMADSAATMTQTQAVIGTAQYLSPEQARGETVDARSDLYSAACLLFELLTGRPPFTGDSPVSVAYQHVRELPVAPSSLNPEVSTALDDVLERGLAKDRNHRYQTAREFREALLAVRDGGPATAATQAIAVPPHAVHPADPQDEEPRTRAMAKVLAGGSLTAEEDADRPVLNIGSTGEREPQQKARRRAWTTVFVILLVLVLGAAGVVGWNVLNAKPAAPTTASVPLVEAMSQSDAFNAIVDAGFRAPSISEEYSDTVQDGLAIRTSPAAGAMAHLQEDITLYISKGPSTAEIPGDLIGMTESGARDALRELDLKGGATKTDNSSTMSEGRVLGTEPAVGERVPVGTEVNIIVSTGKVVVPDLAGLTREQAEATLLDPTLLLTPKLVEVESAEAAPGMVLSQSVMPGTEVAPGTSIVVNVAKAPAEPSPSPSPSSPSPSPSAAQR
ncbi:Stk1 family PASTA domain-containing Ser/Thr kinase [Arthrobacter sp. zg-Y20]|uniref:Stk1 family PASTA domain-containing Ser/Thr kinase n=1 Tax=unclassified Arthrobacter TaxID=235627 RepID=UPI001D148844|nr:MULTISPECIES: Stk1 family PASTA domain-containing Ser/Thr kinase [unclassified Arthrobacter]MCC3275635.1 Stk1 family PASTA domain-containing Ser/Thr kinase [Arthrobacter sp. zg-Y20]MDK1315792.1 Stk1 family PASTA domain-containing Ser/Thr kinase [Arthrobacter sp. zg.Y20]WIB06196.1 Stk1 family PASTA domain-containing Ser/Thr kinase [Arthrobacter sp. zg-Y20]